MRLPNTLARARSESNLALATAGHAGQTQLDLPAVEPASPPDGIRIPRFEPKAAVDFLLAAVLLALATPLILVSAVLVKFTSRGPAFYSQTRVGLRGRAFRIYKLRTMRHNCEAKTGARWATAGDPRVTPVGAFLRTTHLDELPQLWNVLRGDMALVGPRPERPEFVSRLAVEVTGYAERLRVRPGVTGLAQVQLPADTGIESVRLKLAYDLHYIEHATLWLDVRLILSTGLKMLHVPFRVSRLLLRIPSGLVVPSPAAAGPTRVRAGRSRVPA
jgi:lipopolysaccharide/colanic/teichoic acid biosynthesis glycosyltransferase